MLTLVDLGAIFWEFRFGTGSSVEAYSLTLDKIQFYIRNWPKVVVCCDSPKSKRKEWCPDYKSNRKPKPTDGIEALESVPDRVRAWGNPVVQCEGYEADDIIAALVAQSWPEEVQIVGSAKGCEKDFYCLLDDRVRLVGSVGYITANDCVTKFGVAPSQMQDWLALVGDAADAIPGCPGIGPSKATLLLEMFGTIEGVKAASDEELLALPKFGKKTVESIRSWDPTMARKLVKLLDDAPVSLAELFSPGPTHT